MSFFEMYRGKVLVRLFCTFFLCFVWLSLVVVVVCSCTADRMDNLSLVFAWMSYLLFPVWLGLVRGLKMPIAVVGSWLGAQGALVQLASSPGFVCFPYCSTCI